MDKKNLYYLVTTGSNRRVYTHGIPLIVTAESAIRELDTLKYTWTKMSIEEFEETYEHKLPETEVKKI